MRLYIISLILFSLIIAKEKQIDLLIDGMMCAKNCPSKINESLLNVNGVKSCNVDFNTKTAIIVYDDEVTDQDNIAKLITENTYFKVTDKNSIKRLW